MNDLGFRFEEFMFKFLAVNKDVIIELGKKCMSEYDSLEPFIHQFS